MLKRKVPLVYMLLVALFCGVASVVAVEYRHKAAQADDGAVTKMLDNARKECEYSFSRLDGYQHIHPIFLAEPQCESEEFIPLKSQIDEFVQQMKRSGDLFQASVYLKDLNSGDWMDYDPKGTYQPGSLFKVVAMMTVFRMAEKDPALLDKEIAFKTSDAPAPTQTFNSEIIQPGAKYKIKELVRHMIVNSDNNATMLLNNVMNPAVFTSIFPDLGLRKPKLHEFDYAMSAKEYSRLMSVLYDGGYLTLPSSEVATSLLCESAFDQGITKHLPKGLMVAHKFGEAGQPGARELHESAIVYLNGKPYLLTIMTKGTEAVKLAEMISELSRMAYEHMTKQNS